jgi:hypothetical protein
MRSTVVHGHGAVSYVASAAIAAGQAVRLDPANEARVIPAPADATTEPLGIAMNSAAIGKDVAVDLAGNIVLAIANATIANGANVSAVAATSRLGTSPATVGTFRVGIAQQPALVGEEFSVLVNPVKVA